MAAARILLALAVLATPLLSAGGVDENRDNIATVIQNHLSALGADGYWPVQQKGRTLKLKLVRIENDTIRASGPGQYQVLAQFADAAAKGSYEAQFTIDLGDEWKVAGVRWLNRAQADQFRKGPTPAAPQAATAGGGKPQAPIAAPKSNAAPQAPGSLQLRPESEIVIYDPEGYRIVVKTIQEGLRFRGLTGSFAPVNDFQALKDLDLLPRLRAAGLTKGESENVTMPFYSIDGKLVSSAEFDSALNRLPLINVREKDTPYVAVYGLSNCAYSGQGRNMLEKNGIAYEFHDVQNVANQPRFEALKNAYGMQSYEWPVVDINGKLFSNPSIETVRANMQ